MSLYYILDPNILADKRLTPVDFKVYCGLVSYMQSKTGRCFPRYATIAARIGVSKRSVQRSCQNLAKLHLITKKRLQSTNEYLLSQQFTLEQNITKKRVSSLSGYSERYKRNVLIKPFKYNYNTFNSNRSTFSPPGTDKPTLSYKGDTYEECGSEGHWHEFYCKKNGKKIKRHSFKNTIEEVQTSEKKFEAAAKRVVA